MLPNEKTTKRSVIVEEALAWEECSLCGGEGKHPSDYSLHDVECEACHGSGKKQIIPK